MISIYLNYFAAAYVFESKYLKPIQVGKALATWDLDMEGDDQGDNISLENPAFCELTGQYYVWKNGPDSDYYGFMHYRRLLDFKPEEKRKIEAFGVVLEPVANDDLLFKYGLDDAWIEKFVPRFDVILPEPYDVSPTAKSVREQYLTAPFHHIEHLDEAGKVIEEVSPEYSTYFREVMRGKLFYPNNMFVFKKEIFLDYANWIFKILFELERRIDVTGMKWQEQRAIGYIGERLFTVYVFRMLATRSLKVQHVHRVFINNTAPPPAAPAPPKTELPIVTVAAATDLAYVQHMATLLVSTLSNASLSHFIDFNILDGGIGIQNQRHLKELECLHPNCRVSFIDMSLQHLNLTVNSFFSRSTFYRLSLPEVLKDHQKVLYLDTDMVVLRDVAELYETELDGAVVAAVRDLIVQSFIAMGVQSIAESGSLRTSKYLADRLGINSSSPPYFQAGVLIFDLEKMRESSMSEKMIHALASEHYWFLDQDVLNKFVSGRVKYLDERWNTVFMDEQHFETLSADDQAAYKKTFENPWIVHYAGYVKPWQRAGHPLAGYYWNALRKTYWYETGLFSYMEKNSFGGNSNASAVPASRKYIVRQSLSLWLIRSIWRILPKKVQKIFNPIAVRTRQKLVVEL